MGWSPPQQKLFFRACNLADLGAESRYAIMRWVGCPESDVSDRKGNVTRRPSAKNPRNGQGQYDAAMAIVEAHAIDRGAETVTPRNFHTWADACAGATTRTIARIERICELAQATRGVSLKGDWRGAIVPGLVRRMTKQSPAPRLAWQEDGSLEHLDLGTVLKVLRALEAMVKREFARAGLAPPDLNRLKAS